MNEGYPRQCPRCGADIHVPDPEHVCKDIRERGARQERIIAVIEGILTSRQPSEMLTPFQREIWRRATAEAIYKALRDGIADLP